jgi:hypothetical protein
VVLIAGSIHRTMQRSFSHTLVALISMVLKLSSNLSSDLALGDGRLGRP